MEDSFLADWDTVRTAHKQVLNSIEHRRLAWQDMPMVMETKRTSLARIQQSTATRRQAMASGMEGPLPDPCQDYQALKCMAEHGSDGVRVSHICAFCWRVNGNRHTHPESNCRKAKEAAKSKKAKRKPGKKQEQPLKQASSLFDGTPGDPQVVVVSNNLVVGVDSLSVSTDSEEEPVPVVMAAPPSHVINSPEDRDFVSNKVFNARDAHNYIIDGASHFIPDHNTRSDGPITPHLTRFPLCPGPGALDAASAMPPPRASVGFVHDSPDLAKIYDVVAASGVPNYRGARIPLSHGLNIAEWRKSEHLLEDRSLVDMLAFGFPVGYQAMDPPALGTRNHSSAVNNPLHVRKYLDVERSHQAIVGPFQEPPFQPWFRTNLVMTRPKQDSSDFRVILDMSYPPGDGVNAYIPSTALDGAEFKLRLPSPLDLAARMRECGRGCLLFKADLSRAYRQLRSDPVDWPLLGIHWGDEQFVDVSVPFGLRHEAVATVVKDESGAIMHPYIDDTAAASIPIEAHSHSLRLWTVLVLMPPPTSVSPPQLGCHGWEFSLTPLPCQWPLTPPRSERRPTSVRSSCAQTWSLIGACRFSSGRSST